MTSPPERPHFPFSPSPGGAQRREPEETDPEFPGAPLPVSASIPAVREGAAAGATSPRRDFPAQVGPYRLLKEIARGGMGAVYLGVDEALNRQVAIKIMSKDLIADRDALERFQREARAAASVNHPNIAMVYLVGATDDGSPFLAMEYVEGGTLEAVIRDKTHVSLSRVVDIMIQCCEALSAARKKAIIHRDIKPGNIMLARDGSVRIVDFGLAKFLHEDTYRTVAGTVMGTPRYMAPEQSQGREVDYRGDIYSLGATFYHVLTGRAPFDGANPTQIMMKHVTAPVVPLRNVNRDVPMELDDLIRRCMAKNPNDRYQDYMDLIGDLGKLKVQFMARERGSLVSSMADMPTLRLGPGGVPAAPGSSARGASSPATSDSLPAAESDRDPGSSTWRYLAMGAGLLLVVVAVGLALLMPRGQTPPATDPADPQARTGLQVLIERLASQARSDAPMAPPPDPDHLAYLATREIVEELGRALFTFSVEQGRNADSITELAASGAAVQLYDTSARGVPLDGWGRPLDYARGQQAIISMGMDARPNTPDDIRADAEGNLTIEDMSVYDGLEEREQQRLGRR